MMMVVTVKMMTVMVMMVVIDGMMMTVAVLMLVTCGFDCVTRAFCSRDGEGGGF